MSQTSTKNTIWQNYSLDYEDWRVDLEAYYPDEDGCDDTWREQYMWHLNECYLEDEIANLDIKTDDGDIIILADIGLWNGRRSGYRILNRYVSSCLQFEKDCEYAEWYMEDDDLKSRQSHHDGTHYLTYRELLVDNDEFEELYYSGKFNPDVHTRKLGKYINKVYGW